MKNNWEGKCHSCGEKKKPEELVKQNGSICKTCSDKRIEEYEKDLKEGKINNVVIFCQDCQSQYKQVKKDGESGVNPHNLTNQHDRAIDLYDGIPYKISSLILTEWECKCKNKRPLITTGIEFNNWAEGFIDEKNEGEWQCCPPDER